MMRKSLLSLLSRCLVIPTVLVGAGSVGVCAQINSPYNPGYIFRADAMVVDSNFIGAVDQLSFLDVTTLSMNEIERADWLECMALTHIDTEQAIEALSRFISVYPSSPVRVNAILLLGDCYLPSDPSEAFKVYQQINEGSLTREKLADLNYHKGYALLVEGSLDEAEGFFEAAATDARWRKASDFYLGYIAYTQYDYSRAENFFSRVDRNGLPGSMADFYLAQIYYARGEYNKALTAARSLIGRNDVDSRYIAEATRVAGESLFQQGNTAEAVKMLRRYLSMTDTPERSALYILGTYEFNNGHTDEAIDLLRQVTAIDVNDAMAQSSYLFLGQALMDRGDRHAAILAFDNALKMDYDFAVQEAAYYNYAVAKFSGARTPFGSSVATFEEFLRRYPDGKYSAVVQEYLVEGYLASGDYEGAVNSIDRMTNPAPRVIEAKQKALYALGTRALAKGDTDQAVKYLSAAHDMPLYDRATSGRVALSLGEAMARKNEHKKAIDLFRQYLAQAPANDVNRPLARYDIGYSYFALKEYENAFENFSAVNSSPGNLGENIRADVLNRMGDSKLYTGDISTAKTYYRKALDLRPSSGDYPLFCIAVIEGYEGKYKDKIASLDTFLDKYPTSSLVPDALLEMTEGYIQLGDNSSAISTYRRLVSEYPTTEQGRRGYLQMALTLLNSGRRAEAVEAYKDIVTLYPTSEEAQMAVEELKRMAADDGDLPAFVAWLQTIDNAPKLDVGETDRLTFEAAETLWLDKHDISRIELYAKEYPAGAFMVRALGYMTDNAVEQRSHTAVIEYSEQIIERFPDSSQAENALMAKANAEYNLGLSSDALATWTMLETRASSPLMLNTSRVGIMRAARDMGDNERVIAAAEALLASSTLGAEDRNEAEFARALAMAQTGRADDAVIIWKELSASTDDLYGTKSSFYLALHYFNEGDMDASRRQVESLIDSGTPHTYWLARGFILLSDIYMAEGKDFEAREYLRSLRDNYPGTETDIFGMIDERLARF